MSNSTLVTYTRISPHKTPSRSHAIDTITIHCIVAQWTAKQGCDYFATTSAQCSSNYIVGKDGSIGLAVEEKDRSWCTSSSANDNRAVTIEVASDRTHPYAVTDKALEALIELVADICKRNGIKKLVWSTNKSDRLNHRNGCNMTVHCDYANKSCPGEYLYSRHGYIAEQVNKKLGVNVQVEIEKEEFAEYEVGDVVNFIGKTHYASASAIVGSSCKQGEARITATSKGAKHPYHLVRTHGSKSTVYGWVNASDIEEKGNTAVPEKDTKIDTVKEVQTWLNNSYNAKLVVDGEYGPKTKAALVKVLQKALGVYVDGSYGNQTNNAVKNLKVGSSGNAVRALQGLLVCNGYSDAYVDGDYGNGTYNSVKAYQKKKGLYVDGIAGKATFSALCK